MLPAPTESLAARRAVRYVSGAFLVRRLSLVLAGQTVRIRAQETALRGGVVSVHHRFAFRKLDLNMLRDLLKRRRRVVPVEMLALSALVFELEQPEVKITENQMELTTWNQRP